MSYILEALKKSEQERARGREQDLLRFPAAPAPTQTLRPGVVLGLSALLLAGGIAIGWWQPWRGSATPARLPAPPEAVVASAPAPDSAPVAPATTTRAEALRELRPLLPEGGSIAAPPPVPEKPSPAAAPAPATPPRPAAEPASVAPAPRPVVEAPTSAVAPRPAVAAVPAARPAAPVKSETKPAAEPAPRAEERKPAAKPPPAKELPPPPDRVLTISELPASLREALPSLTIRGFVHSDDAVSRVVVVNDRMLHEGDEVAADLRLERIDPDGMVLNFRGYRFLAPR